jgi:hypothetical protein
MPHVEDVCQSDQETVGEPEEGRHSPGIIGSATADGYRDWVNARRAGSW